MTVDTTTAPAPMDQTQARQLARQLSQSTGLVHIAAAVPLGCWGGTETGWDVFGPARNTQHPDR
jgi:hypothetical protein